MATINLQGDFYQRYKAANPSFDPYTYLCAEETVEELIKKETTSEHPGMLLGKVQSGKTRTFISIIALAFDNGFDIAIVLSKNSRALLEQTAKRLNSEFRMFVDDAELDIYDIMHTPESFGIYELDSKLIFVAKKQSDNLRRLIDLFKSNAIMSNKRTLIIDDEADNASIGYTKKTGLIEANKIASQVSNLRSVIINSSYLQVTATPYSLYLQPTEVEVANVITFKPTRPAFTKLVPVPHEYVGGETYFGDSANSEEDTLESLIHHTVAHWLYDTKTGEPRENPGRRDAGYWYKTDKVGGAQTKLFVEEERDDIELVNALRKDVNRWRESKYRGASNVTKDLLNYWASKDRARRLFFCQREAVETIIYLAEIRIPGRTSKTMFQEFAVRDEDIQQLLKGERPGFYQTATDYFPTLVDPSPDGSILPLQRLGCKMATGSGKTVVMAMLVSWAFCNRGVNPNSTEFPNAVLVVCPNLTVKERLQVLRPEDAKNYYTEFDIVPLKYRPLMQKGKVLVTNWHLFNPQSEHEEGGKTYAVVNKGPDTPETFARHILGDDLYRRMPIMVLNDEGHHCWRPLPNDNGEEQAGGNGEDIEDEVKEATVWVEGLDKLNNSNPHGPKARGISLCVDLSATPFYISGSGHPEGRPFPWLVSDFGLVDAIESGIVKIPRMPVMDVTGLPDPKYFKLWETIRSRLQPVDFLPGKARRPKPAVVYREAEGALQQLAGQWKERFEYVESATPGQEHVPPVMIVVCDNTDIAELVYQKISGETQVELVTQADIEDEDEEEAPAKGKRKAKAKWITSYGHSEVLPHFENTESRKHTIRIDTKLLAEAESGDPKKGKKDFAEELRQVVATVGKPGQPGEHVRCVVSVGMLTEGWDANNVTHILGIRAFGSQLLCEQVVGRGLRRMDYTPTKTDDGKELLTEEYVDVYGIPFSVIPFKGRVVTASATEDKPKQHVMALPERKAMEIQFPVVEGYPPLTIGASSERGTSTFAVIRRCWRESWGISSRTVTYRL